MPTLIPSSKAGGSYISYTLTGVDDYATTLDWYRTTGALSESQMRTQQSTSDGYILSLQNLANSENIGEADGNFNMICLVAKESCNCVECAGIKSVWDTTKNPVVKKINPVGYYYNAD